MTRSKYLSALCALVLLVPHRALAEPTLQSIPPGDDKIVVVREGDKAPFTGQLFDNATALRWANWLQQYKAMMPLLEQRDDKVCHAKLEYSDIVLKLEQKKSEAIEKDLRVRLVVAEKARVKAEHDAAHPAWYATPWFGFGVGIVTTVAITYTTVKVTK